MRLLTALLLVLATLQLSGCGKRARCLDPPDQTNTPYPRHYPPADSPDSKL
jgi:hypothetical protein